MFCTLTVCLYALKSYSFQLCISVCFLHCYYPCRVVCCCRAQTEKVLPQCLPCMFIWKLQTWLEFHFFYLKLIGHLTSPWKLFSFLTGLWSQPTLFHIFPTSLSTAPSLETHLTQQPPVPVQIKTLCPSLLKASFLLCIFRSVMILWTGVIITLSASVLSSHSVPSLYLPWTVYTVVLKKSLQTLNCSVI